MRGNCYKSVFAVLLVALPVVLCIAAGFGAYPVDPWQIPRIMWSQSEDEGYRILLYVRFPRVVLASFVGAILAASGAGLQSMFRNPLADPGLTGVSSGAAFAGAAWVVLVGERSVMAAWGLPLAAFTGGVLAVGLVWRIAHWRGVSGGAVLLLTGIALNALAGAGIGLLLYYSDEEELRSVTFWQMGSLGGSSWPLAAAAIPPMLCGILILLPLGRTLNALALGDSEAYHLGVSTTRSRRRIMLASALGVGGAVAASGGVGFIGLVAPHIVRLSCGADNRWVLPCSALLGAILLTGADTLARTVVQPAEMPVGIITSLVGGPFFLWLLLARKGVVHA